MSLTTPSRNTILSSLRSRRTVVWICGAVAVIGIVVLFGTFGRGGPGRHVSRRPSDKSLEVPASPAARSVARRFLETAVGRQDLATAYTLVGPWLKGVPRKQWIKGHNPVTYFPASNLKTAPLNVLSSTKKALMLEVGPLVAAKGTHVRRRLKSLAFRLEVDHIHGKWLVNYFMPKHAITHLRLRGIRRARQLSHAL